MDLSDLTAGLDNAAGGNLFAIIVFPTCSGGVLWDPQDTLAFIIPACFAEVLSCHRCA